jgi:gliding motility-associated-like protein
VGTVFNYSVTVDPTPPTPAVSTNSPVCVGTTLNISASTIPNAVYNWTGPNGFTSNEQNLVFNNAQQTASGLYTVIASVNGCQSLARSVTVTVSNLISVANAGSNQTVCGNNAVVTLNGSITGGLATGIWTSSGSGTFSNSTSFNTTYLPSAADIAAGTVNLTLTSTNNGVCASSSSSIQVTITPTPQVNAGADMEICAGTSATLNPSVTIATGGIWSTSGTGNFSPSNTTLNARYNPSSEDIKKGNVRLILKSTGNGGCKEVSDTLLIRIIALPVLKVNLEVEVMEGKKVQLLITATGRDLQYLWTPNQNINADTVKNPVVIGVNDMTYTITLTGEGGCSVQDNVRVKVLKEFEIPNTFTPNGDGINEKWLIPNLSRYPNCKVFIFNRYGQKVFESVGYTIPWDGIFQGKPLPFGTYYYIIDPGTGNPPYKGYVTIIK